MVVRHVAFHEVPPHASFYRAGGGDGEFNALVMQKGTEEKERI